MALSNNIFNGQNMGALSAQMNSQGLYNGTGMWGGPQPQQASAPKASSPFSSTQGQGPFTALQQITNPGPQAYVPYSANNGTAFGNLGTTTGASRSPTNALSGLLPAANAGYIPYDMLNQVNLGRTKTNNSAQDQSLRLSTLTGVPEAQIPQFLFKAQSELQQLKDAQKKAYQAAYYGPEGPNASTNPIYQSGHEYEFRNSPMYNPTTGYVPRTGGGGGGGGGGIAAGPGGGETFAYNGGAPQSTPQFNTPTGGVWSDPAMYGYRSNR